MSYGGELSGRRRYSALVWTAQEQLRPSAPLEPDPPARFPVVWAGLWRDRPGQFPVARLGQDSEGYRVLSPSPSGQLNMAKEATGRAELGFVTNGLHQESGGTNGTSAGARRELEDAEPVVRKTLDPNRYATKKTIAQGMLDVALLTANASQLRYVLQVGEEHEFYTLMVTLISLSIILQILVGVLLMVLGALDINDESPTQMAADIINDVTVIMVFIITLLNVIIASFGIETTQRLFVTASPAPEAV